MKTIHQVFNSLLTNRDFSALANRLNAKKSLNQLKHILPIDMQNALLSISYKPSKLLFCFNHPSHVYNFNHYKKKDIMYCLKSYPNILKPFYPHISADSMQHLLQNIHIIGYMPKHSLLQSPQSPQHNPTQNCFTELADGTFINYATDPHLRARFEKIRQLILHNAKH